MKPQAYKFRNDEKDGDEMPLNDDEKARFGSISTLADLKSTLGRPQVGSSRQILREGKDLKGIGKLKTRGYNAATKQLGRRKLKPVD